MTRFWKITEKSIGVFQIVWGSFLIAILIWVAKINYDIAVVHFEYSWENISIPKKIKNYHYQILLPLLTIFAGIKLILNKRIGWTTGIITSVLHSISMFLFPWSSLKEKNEDLALNYIFAGSIFLIFTTILVLLLNKKIRNKYEPTKKTWLIIGLLITILLLDKLFL